jgi:SAM-dependent methyltransferase
MALSAAGEKLGVMRKLKQLYRTWHLLQSLVEPGRLPYAWDLDEYLAPYCSSSRKLAESSSLDIGCGRKPWNPFGAKSLSGVDIRADEERNVKYADLTTDPIPFPDAQFDYVTARDFIEHVPRIIYAPGRRFPFIELMNEIWRVLKPGAIFLSRTPVYPFSPSFRDPTHVNIISVETFPLYFDNKNRWAAMYGFTGSFRVIGQAVEPPNLISLLERCEL